MFFQLVVDLEAVDVKDLHAVTLELDAPPSPILLSIVVASLLIMIFVPNVMLFVMMINIETLHYSASYYIIYMIKFEVLEKLR